MDVRGAEREREGKGIGDSTVRGFRFWGYLH